MWGIKKNVSVRKILALQINKFILKGCPLYSIQVLNAVDNRKLKIEDHPMLYEFNDVFPEEVPILPPKRDLYFSKYLILVAILASKVPYRMSTPDPVALKV